MYTRNSNSSSILSHFNRQGQNSKRIECKNERKIDWLTVKSAGTAGVEISSVLIGEIDGIGAGVTPPVKFDITPPDTNGLLTLTVLFLVARCIPR